MEISKRLKTCFSNGIQLTINDIKRRILYQIDAHLRWYRRVPGWPHQKLKNQKMIRSCFSKIRKEAENFFDGIQIALVPRLIKRASMIISRIRGTGRK